MEKSKFPVNGAEEERAPQLTDLVIRVNNVILFLVQGRYYSISAGHALRLAEALTINANQIIQEKQQNQTLKDSIKQNLKTQ